MLNCVGDLIKFWFLIAIQTYSVFYLNACIYLSLCSIAGRRHHSQGKFYKRKHLGVCLLFCLFLLFPAMEDLSKA